MNVGSEGPAAKKRWMIALQYDRFGDPAEVVRPLEKPVPEPPAGQVRIRVLRSPIHNHDLATIRGTYGYKPELPAIGGTELSGVVDAIGNGVNGVQTGMRVAAMATGAWAQYAFAPAVTLVPVPDAIDDERASQLLAMPMSAVVLLQELKVKSGDWIVQNAANGAVGTMLMRLAQKNGVNIINLVRSETAAQRLREAGAVNVVVSDVEGRHERVQEMTGGAPVVRAIDSIAGPQSIDMQRLLGTGGELIVFGGLAGTAMKLDPSLMISNELIVRGFWMSSWMQRASQQQRLAVIQEVFQLALSGELPLAVDATYSLQDCAKALRAAVTPGRHGKVLFQP